MKAIRIILMRHKTIWTPALVCVFFLSCSRPLGSQGLSQTQINAPIPDPDPEPGQRNIKVAILLDTSGSMNGLIEQAKSQLWAIVNKLADARSNGVAPKLEIALYHYGNSTLPGSNGYIQMLTPLTTDLDLFSENLFSLTTNGGSEFCGQAIQTALSQLEWSNNEDDLQMIFIAGNEPFTQGHVPYAEACIAAKDRGIIVNTIFCGDHQAGINTAWKSGADLTYGNYSSINHNARTVYYNTPFDQDIADWNYRLNQTYVWYGADGKTYYERQAAQDEEATKYGAANVAMRSSFKSKASYENSRWDLVDKMEQDSTVIKELKNEDLPENMRTMDSEEREEYVQEKAEERKKIQAKIKELNTQREAHIAEQKKSNAIDQNNLGEVLIESIVTQANGKNFKFE
ncbi:VWA domain-containing protein [bacterium SCSIO 12741]|nr:VWA domain-containing protein [bacterium SCSIO 12741]